MTTWDYIRDERRRQGLTQSGLARRAGVSLPTVQNLEAGRTNPTYSTLRAVLGVLGLEMRVETRTMDWERLAALGAPLMVGEGSPREWGAAHTGESPLTTDGASLLAALRDGCRDLSAPGRQGLDQRRREAVQALLLALRTHFPAFYTEHLAGIPLYEDPLSQPITGRIIRMKRQATSALAEYL